MIKENRTSKYLLYAIGEIILVVIGILIALSINNWNEMRKLQQREVQILKEIKSDLFQTKKDIEEAVTNHKVVLGKSQYLLDAIRLKAPNSDSIYRAFASAGNLNKIVPKTSGFENLKTNGLNTISNDSLRIAITNIFQLRFTHLQSDFQSENSLFEIEHMIFPYQKKYFTMDLSEPYKFARKYSDTLNFFKLKIRDYEVFLRDIELFTDLQVSMFTRSNIVESEMEIVEEIDSIILRIDDELKEK